MGRPSGERQCPECGAAIPVLPGYPDWCERCDWNLVKPPSLDGGKGRFARVVGALGRRAGERMAAELRAAGELRPRWSSAKAAAYAVAAGVHLLTLALIAGGVAAIVVEFPNPASILIGLAMVSVGALMRPRVPRLGDGHSLEPSAAPALHELARSVTGALGRPAPEAIVVDSRWNASWAVVGWRRRRVLVIGLPLLAALEPRERVAVIAHEAGHDRNGDASRGLFVGSAVGGLDALSAVLHPSIAEEDGFFGWVTGGLMWLLSRPVEAALWLEARLLLRDMQRAEYLADAQAAAVAGTAAVVAMHERLLLLPTFRLAVQQAALGGGTPDVLAHVRDLLRSVPERERERRRRVARLAHARLEDTHPPTGMRIALLEARHARTPAVTLDRFASERIDAELESLEPAVGRELVDGYRGSLYYG